MRRLDRLAATIFEAGDVPAVGVTVVGIIVVLLLCDLIRWAA